MQSIDEFLAQLPEDQKNELQRVRECIHQALPDAVEVISYGIPGFKYKGKYLAGFSGYKDHMSFFPSGRPIELLKEKLGAYKLSTGTIQYSLVNPIPQDLIRELLGIRVSAIDSKSKK